MNDAASRFWADAMKRQVEVRAMMTGQLGAPFAPIMVSISPASSSGVPDNSSDVPSFSSGPSASGGAPVNVDRPAPSPRPGLTAGAAPADGKQCDCPSFPWWAWLLTGAATGGTVYGVGSYLLRK